MNTKKNILLVFLIFILFVVTILTSCGGNDMRLNDFSKVIEKGKLDDLSLTIYYMNPFIQTRFPLSVDHLINRSSVQTFVIYGNELEEQIDLINQIGNTTLKSIKKETYLDARIYYVFSTEEEGTILDVAMWRGDSNIVVNGIAVEEEKIFYDVVMPFLPENAVKDLKAYIRYDERFNG